MHRRGGVVKVDCDYGFKDRDKVIQHLKDKYGNDCVSHIGTITKLGIKSGFRDFARALGIDIEIVDNVCKQIDIVTEKEADFKYKNIDELGKSTNGNDKKRYELYCQLEKEHHNVFRLIRKYEGIPRNTSVHASGILITPVSVNDIFPTKTVDDTLIALFDGVQLDKFNALKLDVLGLKTLDIINDTVISVDETKNIYDIYNNIPVNNASYFELIREQKTEAMFQIESPMMKGIIRDMLPETIGDIIALNSIGRPGPLSAGMHTAYNNRKNKLEEWTEPLPNTLDIVEDTFGTIIYQEQVMLIAQRVAKFNGNQSDSYLRKALSKKKADMLDLCRRWFVWGKLNEAPPKDYDEENINQVFYDPDGIYGEPILGGIHNNNLYTEQMLIDFFEQLKGYAKYLFNKSHSATYSYLTCITAYLSYHHKTKFFAQVLSMEGKEGEGGEKSKLPDYIDVCRDYNIKILPPDINNSKEDFCAINDKEILFGLSSVAKVNKASEVIIKNRPYQTIEDLLNKTTKKEVNKGVIISLVKAGAFDFVNNNRNMLINMVYELRKDKDEKLNEISYDMETCRAYEKEVLKGCILKYPSAWNKIEVDKEITLKCVIDSVKEKNDKKGNLMGFFTLIIDGKKTKSICFASRYNKIKAHFVEGEALYLKGKKDDKGTFVVNGMGKKEQAKTISPMPKRYLPKII